MVGDGLVGSSRSRRPELGQRKVRSAAGDLAESWIHLPIVLIRVLHGSRIFRIWGDSLGDAHDGIAGLLDR